jgi:hypothetical protein
MPIHARNARCVGAQNLEGDPAMDESAGLVDFVGFGELAETTSHLLALNLQAGAGMRPAGRAETGREEVGRVEQMVLQQARDYLAQVREGFMLTVRTDRLTQRGELTYLLARVITDWRGLSRELLGADDVPGALREEVDAERLALVRRQVLAFGMAVIALGQLPRMPAKQVTFPHSYGNPPTYGDIPVPSTPGEMLWRIEELEQIVWRLMSGELPALLQRSYGPLRRTYGFFEAGAWLSRKEAIRFGVKPAQTPLTFF